MTDASPWLPPRLVVVGSDALAARLVEELARLEELADLDGLVTAVVADAAGPFAALMRRHATVVEGRGRDVGTLRASGVGGARALALLDDDDVGNVHAALAAQELNPDLRLVVRMFNRRLGERLEHLFTDCTVLSSSAIAAPFFVDAALGGGTRHLVRIGGRLLDAGTPDAVDAVLVPLARPGVDGPDLLPADGDRVDLVLGVPPQATTATGSGRSARWPGVLPWLRRRGGDRPGGGFRRALSRAGGWSSRRLRTAVAVLAGLAVAGAVVFHQGLGMSWLDAVYTTVAAVTTGGPEGVLAAPAWVKAATATLMVLGVVLVALITAFAVDDLVGTRLARTLGVPVGRPADHVVVCGLGTVGLRVAEQLHAAGVAVVGVERDPDAASAAAAARLGVPVVRGDASEEETLLAAGVPRARCLVAVTDDEIANLEAGLAARALRPDIRVVLRLYDADLADRVDRRLGLSISRSVSTAAAPVFAAAMVGREVVAAVPYGRRVLLVADVPVEPGSAADGGPLTVVDQVGGVRVFGRSRAGAVTWSPPLSGVAEAGDRLLVVATRAGLARTLLLTGAAGTRPAPR